MLKIRKCAQCQEPKLMPVARKMQIYNSVVQYRCENCAAEVEITPVASTGVSTMVGLMVFSFWGWIIFGRDGADNALNVVLFGLAILVYSLITFAPLIKHLQNPPLKNSIRVDLPVAGGDVHVARKPILWVESLGYFSGFLAPLVIVLGVLGGAALIGYINFTYF